MYVQDIFDARENIDGGVRYLRVLTNEFDGDMVKIVAAYNAGPGRGAEVRRPGASVRGDAGLRPEGARAVLPVQAGGGDDLAAGAGDVGGEPGGRPSDADFLDAALPRGRAARGGAR